METYPGELLVGVFPLVFCVDATLSKATEEAEGDSGRHSDSSSPPHARSQFDRFLDAMAASLMNDMEDHPLQIGDDPMTTPSKPDGMMSLFRSEDEDDDSEAEDEALLSPLPNNFTSPGISASYDGMIDGGGDLRKSVTSAGRSRSFNLPRFSVSRTGSRSSNNNNASEQSQHLLNTSYAKALQQGQGFFQRARIVSISTRHGFPPSKDPNGTSNRVNEFMEGTLNNKPSPSRLKPNHFLAAIQKRPIDGILPSGWMEKHAHALPSVLLVVVQVTHDQQQFQQNELLLRTLDNLQISLASKRQCTIQIVGLVQEGVSQVLAEQWTQTIADKLKGQELTLISTKDLQQDAAPSLGLKHLHKTVRDASLNYYLHQTRRTKHKLFKLGPTRGSPLSLPLSIRYCFKIAMLYEFQWKQEKSLKFLVEAYRHVETYYRYLLQQRNLEDGEDAAGGCGEAISDNDNNKKKEDPVKISVSNHSSSETANTAGTDGTGEGVELALQSPASANHNNKTDDMDLLLLKSHAPPEDMVHQCRAVADWLNFKILQSGFVSHTEGGLLAASTQWQKHSQAFCSPRRSFVCSPDHAWLDWSYVAHQRVVVSQLLERHPPNALGGLGNLFDEVILRCSPWRTYQSAAEALLKLGSEVQKSAGKIAEGSDGVDKMRTRYVGGLDNTGYTPKLQEETKVNHREKALDCIMRAISSFERDVEKAKQDEEKFLPWNRSGARMYYLAGSTLLGQGRHAEAMPYLEKAIKAAKGWNGLELAIRKILIECYEKQIPSEADESSQTLASMLLDSYFNAEMSNSDLRRALEKFSSISGGGTIKWYRDCIYEADESLPFSFSLTFPAGTHAIAGDEVEASVLIKSNLDYAVHVNSVTLLSLAGQISVPSTDLLSATNANEGSNGGIIIQANADILLSTQIELPKDLSQIAVDETGNGGENEGVAGKGSFAKSARPRTAGLTAAGGVRFVAEDIHEDSDFRRGNSQWSLQCLGGKPLRCDGVRLVFYPVHSATVNEGKNTEIELTIEKKQKKTEAKIKRTPFEEDNHISSAWMRPKALPMSRGPRCLRVLSPLSEMIVTNLTEPFTGGKVLEGTVNRIIFKLKAGPQENCTDVKFRVTCSSLLISAEGKTKKISSEESDDQENNPIADMKNPCVRTPVLVTKDESSVSQMTEYGYAIPSGWSLVGNGQGMILDNYNPAISTLKSGESTYAYFDVYRPPPNLTRMDGVVQDGINQEDLEYDRDMCQTDIDISVCYRQTRTSQNSKKAPPKRRARSRKKKDEESDAAPPPDEKDELVYFDHSVAVLWSAPILAVFSPGMKQTQPSGNRHPSNNVPDPNSPAHSLTAATKNEMVLIDGERVLTKCAFEAVTSADGLLADIEQIKFEDNEDEQSPCHFRLLSGKNDDGLLYKAEPNDPCSKLILGSTFSLAWMTEVNMKSAYLKGSVSSSLGVVSVDWIPSTLKLPEEITLAGLEDSVAAHGPLQLTSPSTCRFMGPPCYIENAPFEATVEGLPASLRVAEPFDVVYHIKNKTSFDQKLLVQLDDSEPAGNDSSQGFLISGVVNGAISLGPFETHTLSYTALATRTGQITMPRVGVSSDRYKTWLIQEASISRRSIFILP